MSLQDILLNGLPDVLDRASGSAKQVAEAVRAFDSPPTEAKADKRVEKIPPQEPVEPIVGPVVEEVDNTKLYIGAGVAVIALIGLTIILKKKG